MPRPARDLCVAYETIRLPKSGKVATGTLRVYRHGNPRIIRFNQSWSASGPRQDDDRLALTNILSLFRHLTVFEGIPAELVHAKFMRIAEYADHVSDDRCF
jgi:hypothetical protein